MNFIKRLLGQDGKFYDLLESSADEARNSVTLLSHLIQKLGTQEFEAHMTSVVESRRRHKQLRQEIMRQVCRTFVTPLEREDIEALSSALYKVPKTVEKIAERLSVVPDKFATDIISTQVSLLADAAEAVETMVKQLRHRSHGESIAATYEALQTIEGDADRIMIGLLRGLYQGDVDAKEVLVLKDLYELLERAIDRFRDAGNVIFQVMLKYS